MLENFFYITSGSIWSGMKFDKYLMWVYIIVITNTPWGYKGGNMNQCKADEKIGLACSCKHKSMSRSEDGVKQLQNRLNRIIGQVNGISKMLEDNRYCGDILTQVAAVESALQSFGYVVLKEHLNSCVVEAVQQGNTEIMDEAIELIKKLK